MKIKLSNKLYITDAPMWLYKWCYNNLVLPNPDFYKKEKLGKWTGNTPREIFLYEKVGDTLVLPFGIWNRHFYEMVRPETESIESDIEPFKAIEYKSGTTLYTYQEKAVKEALTKRNGIIVMPCGAGKTQTAIELIARLGGRALWLTHTGDLLNQSYNRAKDCLDVNKDTYGKITDGKVNIGTGITVATVQTMAKMDLTPYKYEWDVIVVDECMPGNALIDTPSGKVPLKNLCIDDIITSYNRTTGKLENKRILNVFKSKAHHIVRIRLSDGEEIICTCNHPILTKGKSWMDAERLVQNDYVLRLVWENGGDRQYAEYEQTQGVGERLVLLFKRMFYKRWTQKDSMDRRKKAEIFAKNESVKLQKSRFVGQEDDGEQSYEECENKSKGFQEIKRDRTPSKDKVWKWARLNSSTADLDACISREPRCVRRISYSNKDGQKKWLSDLLQSGHSNSKRDDSDRSGWKFSLCNRETGTRREKRYILDWVRVESVEIQEQTSDGTYNGLCPDGYVYNVEVEDNNNYFADGILVHNCHKAIGSPTKVMQFYKVVSSLACRYKIGLTATPERSDGLHKSMLALLGDIIITIPKEAVAATTCPVKVKYINTGYAPSEDAFGTDGTMDYISLVDDLTHDEARFKIVFDAIKGLKSCLVLANRVEYLERLTKAYNETGGNAICLSTLGTSKKAKETRKESLKQLNAGNLDCIFATYQLACEGLDVPSLKYVVLATPEKDERIVTQAVGRVGRKAEGKAYGTVIDVKDDTLQGWASLRKRYYKKLEYDIY